MERLGPPATLAGQGSPKPPPSPTDAEWLAQIEAKARCGLLVPECARQHGLNADTLFKRRRRLAGSLRGDTARACERVPFAGYERSREEPDRAAFEETLGAA